jgi:1,4-alpha-glucan branching enzyme
LGYQLVGYFAPTSLWETKTSWFWLINYQAGIGVILDWVPSHFPDDAQGFFFGSNLFIQTVKKDTIQTGKVLF